MDKDVLLSCPFDGYKAKLYQSSEETWFVICLKCNCEVYGRDDGEDGRVWTKDEVIKYWNTRTPQEPCELVKLDEKEVTDLIAEVCLNNVKNELCNKGLYPQMVPSRNLAVAICSKFGTAPAQRSLSLEFLQEEVAHKIFKSAYYILTGADKTDTDDLVSAIKAKMDANQHN